jgi:hypothetical protein|tara:strand:+ start:1466 stop:1909 length:444 start_codon:yes stop_codon:yes gene_type:complete
MWDIKMNKLLTPILLVILMSGCASTGLKPLEIFTTEVERERLNLPLPPVETMEKVRIIVITSKNQEEVFAKLVKQNIDPAIIGYTDEDWELVQKNSARSRQQIIRLRRIVEEYKKYYEATIDEAPEEVKKQFSISSLFNSDPKEETE